MEQLFPEYPKLFLSAVQALLSFKIIVHSGFDLLGAEEEKACTLSVCA